MRRSVIACIGVVVGLLVAAAPPADATGAPVPLVLPSATAFALLGHSCGGIQQQDFATGFGADGYPTGAVYVQTRCGASGRGGGYHVTTYSAWAQTSWDFGGGLLSSAALTAAPTVDPAFTATDARGDTVTNSLSAVNLPASSCAPSNVTYCSYRAVLTVAAPAAPAAVTITQVADALSVTWSTPTTGGLPASTTVSATPASGSALTATVAGTATTASVPGVAPATTYSVVVTSTNAGGTSSPSARVLITTGAASTVPGAPTSVHATWSTSSAILVRWVAATSGNSPTDDYQVSIATYDPNGTPTLFDAGTASTFLATGYNSVPDYAVKVRAHNAAGWGPWSTRVILGGL